MRGRSRQRAVVNQIFVLALTAALNPTLVAASTVMMLLPSPKKLMLGYLLGALLTSVTLGLLIIFEVHGSGATSTTQHTISPIVDIVLGGLAVIIGLALKTDRDRRLAERRRAKKGPKEEKGPPKWQQVLSKGSAWSTFAVGAVLTLPGASYLAGLHEIDSQNYSNAKSVAVVLAFNVVMLMLLEVPLASYVVAPDWTPGAVTNARNWVGRRGRGVLTVGILTVGAALILKGVIGLLN